MNPDEFRSTLHSIGWKQSDLARRLGLHRNTITAWGADGPPAWAAEYLAAMLAIAELHQRFILAPPRARLADPDVNPAPEGATRAARMAQQLAGIDPASTPVAQTQSPYKAS